MKRLVIIVEGDTEESFVNDVMRPYFYSNGFYNYIQCYKLKQSDGGISKYSHLKKDIINTIYESEVLVTTMIDFYRLPSDFPGYQELESQLSHIEQVCLLEEALKANIEETQDRKFDNLIPFIQLHEFEALIFSSIEGFDTLFEKSEIRYKEIKSIIDRYPNPEDINNGPNTAPSVRLIQLIPGYDKVLYGVGMLKNIGMNVVIDKCPHFREWIYKLMIALR